MLQSTKHRLSTRCNCCMVRFAATALSRRELLAGGAGALAIGAAAGFAPTAFAQAAPHRIDVHHHVSPPTWLDAVKSLKKDNPPMVSWSVQKSLDDMDKGGVATAITSPTTPQVIGLDKATAARVARESNEYCKKLESDHKGRFGTFAMLPFPHVDECLRQLTLASSASRKLGRRRASSTTRASNRASFGRSTSVVGQSRRLSDVGMSASTPTTDVSLRRSESTLWAKNRHQFQLH